MGKKILLDFTIEELKTEMENYGYKKYRALQIYKWINKNIISFDEMTDLPKDVRDKLYGIYDITGLKILKKISSKQDETVKYLFAISDNDYIESVLLKYKFGYAVCVSTQAGCRMGCKFCASSKVPFTRNLTSGEILGQIVMIQFDIGQKIDNIILMGIGEPFDNYENVMKFIRTANSKDGLNIGLRRITVSTCGIIPAINNFMNEAAQVNLSISLHAPNNDLRKKIMPISKKYPLDELLKILKDYADITGRRVSFEYSMIENFNDKEEHAYELAEKIKNILCYVNLIQYNETNDIEYKKARWEKLERFRDVLIKNGITTTIRRELGSDINAACGQLRKGSIG